MGAIKQDAIRREDKGTMAAYVWLGEPAPPPEPNAKAATYSVASAASQLTYAIRQLTLHGGIVDALDHIKSAEERLVEARKHLGVTEGRPPREEAMEQKVARLKRALRDAMVDLEDEGRVPLALDLAYCQEFGDWRS